MSKVLNHNELCQLAVKWLKRPASGNGHGCQIAIAECRTYGECPDAIGFRYTGHEDGSIVVECKTSRADFLADFKKPHRAEGKGMGLWRYFMCPENLIYPSELPKGWGLLFVNSRGHVKSIVGATACDNQYYGEREISFNDPQFRFENHDWQNEQSILVRWLLRIGDPEAAAMRIREAERGTAQRVKRIDDLIEQNRKLKLENFNFRQRGAA